ncbi:MAG: glycoside hydrolase family 3 N-terminal domain-containing protein [Bacteroidota bacterium]|nr:glycoside hydrolase family 3 N-terminal domain-containing protein [Bacteroidota bacterium]
MNLKRRLAIIILILIIVPVKLISQQTDPPFIKYINHPWVDSVMITLGTDQRIAQCLWIAAYSGRDVAGEVEVADQIRKYGVGGLIFFQGTPEKQAELTNFYQSISAVPLIIAMDAEWGAGMRLRDVEKFPYQMTLGAISNDSLIYKMGKSVAGQLKRLSVAMNLAPVADINNNPLNPVINYRSFGENRENVTSKALMYMKGMQDHGILATAKHFPGHGDTNTDSHLDLPVLSYSRARLDSLELFPFLNLINDGIGSVMTAHLNLPSLDTTSRLPSTLSKVIISDLLKSDLGFKGLVITDAMNMKAVTKYYSPGEAEARAFLAGNDVVEFVLDLDDAIKEIRKLLSSKALTKDVIELKCRKVLALKYWAGLNKQKVINTEDLSANLSSPEKEALIHELYANALTVLNNRDNLIPLRNLPYLRIATLAINKTKASDFQTRLLDYQVSDTFAIDPSDEKASDSLLHKLSGYNLVIAGIFDQDQRPGRNFGIGPSLDPFLGKLTGSNRTIVVYFGNPYALDKLDALQKADGLILAYQENNFTEDLAAQLIYGGIGGKGRLPVTINKIWPCGAGINTEGNLRLQFAVGEYAGISSKQLEKKVDSIAKAGLNARAYPGCEVMIARKGVVILHRTYGYHTYDDIIPVSKNDLYDLASVTKVSSALAGLMLLDSEGKFSVDKKLGDYLPYFRKSNKGNLLLKDILTHQAGLKPFIPFWKETLNRDNLYKKRIYNCRQSDKYPLKVAENLYINRNYRKKMFSEIRKSPLGEKKYVYSDLAFIITPEIIDRQSGEKWNKYVTDSIYCKLGASNIGFNPYSRFSPDRILPTEYDSLFRKQLLHGTVHDEGAAMLGGISGHAGLFSTAIDLMKVMELYRRMGNYGGEQIINREVLRRYSTVQFPENNNRRGLGFDKPMLDNKKLAPNDVYPCVGASPESFGHSGYTGTFVWIDPVYEITYVFLTNRVYPTRNNTLLYDMNIRTDILQAVYDCIIKGNGGLEN